MRKQRLESDNDRDLIGEDDGISFVEEIVRNDLKQGRHQKIVTRFPPEPNGYLHIGHAKAIVLNFGLAAKYGGICNLRFDDTNPETAQLRFARAIIRDISWLGFDPGDRIYHASDYFERLYEAGVALIKAGKAFVCDLNPEELKRYRGNYHEAGKPSPWRDRSCEDNLDLFARMRAGEFRAGDKTLRAKIDAGAANMNLRDPPLFRIRHTDHATATSSWCIYPMYDFAHALSDAFEEITHSLCTLEFENHRPLYDWCVDNVPDLKSRPRQIEFARLNLTHTVLSKRWLGRLVDERRVDGWDDPRMPTIAGMRRRGYPPRALVRFAKRVGVAKADSRVDIQLLEHEVRSELNETAPRVMGVLRPLRVVITNLDPNANENLRAPLHPTDSSFGERIIPFSRQLFIERDDFQIDPPPKWHRLAPGKEVRLRWACLITCEDVVTDDAGTVIELRCRWDPQSRGGTAPDGRKVRGTIHWVSEKHALSAQVHLYEHLFVKAEPLTRSDQFISELNPRSFESLRKTKVEPFLARAEKESNWQFERLGYFFLISSNDQTPGLVFNRIVKLKDSWTKIERRRQLRQGA